MKCDVAGILFIICVDQWMMFWNTELIRTAAVQLSECLVCFRAERSSAWPTSTHLEKQKKPCKRWYIINTPLSADRSHWLQIYCSVPLWWHQLHGALLLTHSPHLIPVHYESQRWSDLNLYFIWRRGERTQPRMTLTEIWMKPLLHLSIKHALSPPCFAFFKIHVKETELKRHVLIYIKICTHYG